MKKLCSFILAFFLIFSTNLVTVDAKGLYGDEPENSYSGWGSENWADPVKCHLELNADGTITIYYSVFQSQKLVLYIDVIRMDGTKISRKAVDLPGTTWGGELYKAPDNHYYVATGNDDTNAFYISKYNSQWQYQNKASISKEDSYTREAFDAGNCEMTLVDNILVVHAARGRMDGHQSNTTFFIDTITMRPSYVTGQFGFDHVSHSFNQFVKNENNSVIMVDHGDAYPRSVLVQKFDLNTSDIDGSYSNYKSHEIFTIEGTTGDNYTGTTVDGFEIAPNNYIVVGTKFFDGEDPNNIFAAVVSKDLSSSSLKKLTQLESTQRVMDMSFLKVDDKSFLLLYGIGEEGLYKSTCYMLINDQGTILKQGSLERPFYCTSEPAYRDNKIVWAHFTDNELGTFLVLNQWNLNTGTCNVTSIDTEVNSKVDSINFVQGSAVEMPVGEEMRFNVRVHSSVFGEDLFPDGSAVWTVSDSSILEVENPETVLSSWVTNRAYKETWGTIKAKKSGTATLTVRIGNKKAEMKITVMNDWAFVDVPSKNWYYDTVLEAYELGLMTGTDESHFSPDQPMSRGMVATVLYRMAGAPDIQYKSIFGDVPKSAYYAQAVTWAYQNKIISGYGNGKFGPDDNVTREEMAVMLCNYARFTGMKVNSNQSLEKFKDYKNVTSYAIPSMRWVVEKGIITGTEDRKLNPISEATRAECAKMLLQSYKMIK